MSVRWGMPEPVTLAVNGDLAVDRALWVWLC